MKNLKKISSGTITRLLQLLVVIVYNSVTALGLNPTSETTAGKIAMIIITAVICLNAYWKNNSFTDAAIEADEYLKEIKSKMKDD